MKKIFLILFVMLSLSGFSQKKYNAKNTFTIVTYNVENLFDTIDSPDTDDAEFLPSSESKWISVRYNEKLKNLDKVLSSINANELPEIIGLCEVENRAVVEDLCKQSNLAKGKYKVVHEESIDPRGIDVALMYRESEFKYLSHSKFFALDSANQPIKSRNILYVKGIASQGDTLHIFVNHWSSRRGGADASEPKRVAFATALRKRVDSLLNRNSKPKIVIMGDCNDEPSNKSIKDVLLANNTKNNANKKDLYNLMYDKHLNKEGTHFYKTAWNMLDNMIVSQQLLDDKKGFHTDYEGGTIFKPEWILYKNQKTGEQSPSRSYAGKKYVGGYSDHLPVYVMLRK